MKNVSEMAKQYYFNESESGGIRSIFKKAAIFSILISIFFCVLLCVRWWANIRLMKGTKNVSSFISNTKCSFIN